MPVKPDDGPIPEKPHVPIDHELDGYRIVELPGIYPRRYDVITPKGQYLGMVSHFGAGLKTVQRDQDARRAIERACALTSWDEMGGRTVKMLTLANVHWGREYPFSADHRPREAA